MDDIKDDIKYVNEEPESPHRIDKLRKALKVCKGERQEYLEGWQRARADFLNYKKQLESGMVEFRKFATKEALLKILPALDNLGLAVNSVPDELKDNNWTNGIVNIKRQLDTIFTEMGLEEIKIAGGEKFNPEHHETIEEVTGAGESGTIVEVLQKGYMLNGKVVRAARVKVVK